MNDSTITELAIVRPEFVYVRQRGTWHEHPCPALTLPNLKGLVLSLAVYNGLDLTPIMVVRLPDGERGQVVQSPACPDGTFIINIRKHTRLVKTLEELEADGAFGRRIAAAATRGQGAAENAHQAQAGAGLEIDDYADLLAIAFSRGARPVRLIGVGVRLVDLRSGFEQLTLF